VVASHHRWHCHDKLTTWHSSAMNFGACQFCAASNRARHCWGSVFSIPLMWKICRIGLCCYQRFLCMVYFLASTIRMIHSSNCYVPNGMPLPCFYTLLSTSATGLTGYGSTSGGVVSLVSSQIWQCDMRCDNNPVAMCGPQPVNVYHTHDGACVLQNNGLPVRNALHRLHDKWVWHFYCWVAMSPFK